jgi:hypothetical protein
MIPGRPSADVWTGVEGGSGPAGCVDVSTCYVRGRGTVGEHSLSVIVFPVKLIVTVRPLPIVALPAVLNARIPSPRCGDCQIHVCVLSVC